MMKSGLGGARKILIDADKSNPMLYLPLDQMLKNAPRKSSGGDPDYVTIPTPPSSSSSGSDSSAAEDNARSRDRRSEEHTSELQSLMRISYAVFCLKKKNSKHTRNKNNNTRESS